MKLTAQILCDIISKVGNIPPEQIWIWNQRRKIPEDKNLYVVVGVTALKVYSNMLKTVPIVGGMQDQGSQYLQETMSIDMFSYTPAAVQAIPTVLGALRSTYSQQQQEALGLKIAEVPISVNDVSDIEGAAMLFRISIALNVLRKYDTLTATQYYDSFDLHLLTENGQVI